MIRKGHAFLCAGVFSIAGDSGDKAAAANHGAAFKHLGVFGVWLSELRKHKVPVMI